MEPDLRLLKEDSEGDLSMIDGVPPIEVYDGDITALTFNHVKSSKAFEVKKNDKDLFEVMSEDEDLFTRESSMMSYNKRDLQFRRPESK